MSGPRAGEHGPHGVAVEPSLDEPESEREPRWRDEPDDDFDSERYDRRM